MSEIADIIKNKEGFVSLKGASLDNISKAEKLLSTTFSNEYKEYVLAFGAASFLGHELTGICTIDRLNVVSVTEKLRSLYDVKEQWYVVEETGFDGTVVWQSPNGLIYRTTPGSQAQRICNSLMEYII